jgi:SAM-dependent methyltransferase
VIQPDADVRHHLYEHLHHDQLVQQEQMNRASARLILELLFERYRPKSVLDVGCGIGTWLSVAGELGVADMAGVEGPWLDRKLARIPEALISTVELEQPFDLGRRFDLVINLEVAEHLSPDAAESFIGSLTKHADVVLFSAAIPFQGGTHHVNEQFPDYWEKIFDGLGYVVLDFIRPQIWYSSDVLFWLRQNTLVFAKEALTQGRGPFAGMSAAGPLSLVHPELYMARVGSIAEHGAIVDLLLSGKTISAQRGPDGSLVIEVTDKGK